MQCAIDELKKYGVTGPSRVITEADAAYARIAIEQHFAQGAAGGAPIACGWHARVDWAYRIASAPVILDTVSRLSAADARSSPPNFG